MSERIRHLGSPPGRPVTLPVDTDVDALWTSYTGVISNLTGESPSHKRGFGELRDRCQDGSRPAHQPLLSPAATDLAPQALELLLRSHLLCEEHRLHALHQPLEPADELRFGDLKLGGGRGLPALKAGQDDRVPLADRLSAPPSSFTDVS